jgi:hypothetical protein
MDEYIAFVNQRLALLPERVRPQPVVNLQSSFKDGYAMLGTPHRERERKEREEGREVRKGNERTYCYMKTERISFSVPPLIFLTGLIASYDPTFISVMENPDITVETKLKRGFGRAQLLFEIPAILTVDV